MEVSKENLIDIRLFIFQEYQQGIWGYKKMPEKNMMQASKIFT